MSDRAPSSAGKLSKSHPAHFGNNGGQDPQVAEGHVKIMNVETAVALFEPRPVLDVLLSDVALTEKVRRLDDYCRWLLRRTNLRKRGVCGVAMGLLSQCAREDECARLTEILQEICDSKLRGQAEEERQIEKVREKLRDLRPNTAVVIRDVHGRESVGYFLKLNRTRFIWRSGRDEYTVHLRAFVRVASESEE